MAQWGVIYSVSGTLAHKDDDHAVVEACGVGYQISCAPAHLARLGDRGSQVRILTHLVHREDAMILYGFETEADRELFLLLVAINGIGASKALGLLNIGGTEAAAAIRTGDVRRLAQAPGIGAKIAQRIVLELKGKLSGQPALRATDLPPPVPTALAEAELALLSLGYTEDEARMALASIPASTPVEDAIRQAILAVTES